jgi:hypothetical protein
MELNNGVYSWDVTRQFWKSKLFANDIKFAQKSIHKASYEHLTNINKSNCDTLADKTLNYYVIICDNVPQSLELL